MKLHDFFFFLLKFESNPHNKFFLQIGAYKYTIILHTWDGFIHSVKAAFDRRKYISDPRTSVYTKLIGVEIESSIIMDYLVFYIGPLRLALTAFRKEVKFKKPVVVQFTISKKRISTTLNPETDLQDKIGLDGVF